jgi:hypothetical protein
MIEYVEALGPDAKLKSFSPVKVPFEKKVGVV